MSRTEEIASLIRLAKNVQDYRVLDKKISEREAEREEIWSVISLKLPPKHPTQERIRPRSSAIMKHNLARWGEKYSECDTRLCRWMIIARIVLGLATAVLFIIAMDQTSTPLMLLTGVGVLLFIVTFWIDHSLQQRICKKYPIGPYAKKIIESDSKYQQALAQDLAEEPQNIQKYRQEYEQIKTSLEDHAAILELDRILKTLHQMADPLKKEIDAYTKLSPAQKNLQLIQQILYHFEQHTADTVKEALLRIEENKHRQQVLAQIGSFQNQLSRMQAQNQVLVSEIKGNSLRIEEKIRLAEASAKKSAFEMREAIRQASNQNVHAIRELKDQNAKAIEEATGKLQNTTYHVRTK